VRAKEWVATGRDAEAEKMVGGSRRRERERESGKRVEVVRAKGREGRRCRKAVGRRK
jgi:hypothetical protein